MRSRGGFSLIEVMMGMAVLAVGSTGALLAVNGANLALREGQMRYYKQVLVDSALARTRLQNKEALFNSGITPAADPRNLTLQPIGGGDWVKDPTPFVANDLSTGSLFIVRPDGTIGPCNAASTPACAGIANCASAALPRGVFCREVITANVAPPTGVGPILPAGSVVITRWVRVSQKKQNVNLTNDTVVVASEVYAR
ncbi:MAG: prepilin-type N-terminal cleavage/methylation domain-containing protein [Myxococcaceae bacterium]